METALITGASSGIGEAFARALADRGLETILVARSREKLERLAQQLREQQGVRADVLEWDLSVPGAASSLVDRLAADGRAVDWLINNAGFGDYGPFAESDRAKQAAMVDLNVRAVMELAHGLLPPMLERGRGTIVNVSSIAGFQPLPYMTLYAATKAFVLSFSEALWVETRDRGVRVLALCPGPTATDFFKTADFPSQVAPTPQSAASPEEVVREAIAALEAGKSNAVTGGLGNQVLVNAPRFVPRSWLVESVGKLFAPKDR